MKLFKLVLVISLVINSFVLGGCKPSVPGTYVNQKDDTVLSGELTPDGTCLLIGNKGKEVVGKYVVNGNTITFTMFGIENKGEIKGDSIIMQNGEIWKKKK